MSAAGALLERLDELLPEIERGRVPGWARAGLAELLQSERANWRRRQAGAGKARAARTAKLEAACAAHLWKVPITAPDLVERLQAHFATAGLVAPDARFIRRWRDKQISERQHTGAAGQYGDANTPRRSR